jgi:hypothetical protein
MNCVADVIGEFTDKLADKLNFEDNNSSNSQNLLSNVDPFNPNFDLSTYNNQQIELNDDDQIDVDDDDEEKNNVPFPPSKQPSEEKNSVDDLFNFINTSIATTNLPSPVDLPPLYSTPSELGPVLPPPPIYSTSKELPPFPARSAIYSIPSKFTVPPPPSSNVSSQEFNPNDIFSLTSSDLVNINEFEVNEDDEDEEKNKIIFGAQYLTTEVAWSLTNLNR